MTDRQEDKITMWTTVNAVLENYPEVWSTLDGFANAANAFFIIREEIDPSASLQKSPNKGYTEAKHISGNDLISFSYQMALNIKSYAMNAKDFVLTKQYQYSLSDFNKFRDNELPTMVKDMVNKAKELDKALNAYGVTVAEIEELNNALKEYNVTNPAVAIAKGQSKQATVNIAKKLAEGTEQLELMDNLAGNFNKKNPEFVAAFRNARIVIKRGSRKKTKNLPPDSPEKPE